MTMRLSTLGLPLPAMLLTGCAALQIDVDVYKGPLVNRLDIQARQYVYLVEAAKPLVERMHRESVVQWREYARKKGAADAVEPTPVDSLKLEQDVKAASASTEKMLTDFRQLYQSKKLSDPSNRNAVIGLNASIANERSQHIQAATTRYRCPSGGVTDLVEVCNYFVRLLADLGRIERLTQQLAIDPGLNRTFEEWSNLDAYLVLNEAVIRFATQINYVTAQIKLYEDQRIAWLDTQADILLALSNILLVHANDINRQLERMRGDASKVTAELAAVGAASSPDKTTLFPPCRTDKDGKAACTANAKSQTDVLDLLISELRAKRIRALAKDDAKAAAAYQSAIDAAHAQRASMAYLRPAGDYLRSVHLASGLQDAPDQQHRNMLNDWFRYFIDDKDNRDARRKAELDKLSWQNINRVTLGGGGTTDFVVAKDDVGNWYVKAYGANPDTIIKAATGLAMFNAGSRVNLNLMQRYDLQSRIDALPDGSTDKPNLIAQRDELQVQNTGPLRAMQERYAEQYAQATYRAGEQLRSASESLPAQIDAGLKGIADDGGHCAVAKASEQLAPLVAIHIQPPAKALTELQQQRAQKHLPQWEAAIRSSLSGFSAFADDAYRRLSGWRADQQCDQAWRQAAADNTRALTKAVLLRMAEQRRGDVERYEAALNNIMEVASQK
jgi:hypothetical protein